MIAPCLKIWLLVVVLGWGGFPLLRLVFRNLPDRGFAVAKGASLVLVTYGVWLGAHFGLHFTATALRVSMLVVLLCGAALYAWQWREMLAFFKARGRYLLVAELVFALGLAVFVTIVSHNAAVDPDSERMMDYAMVQGVLRSGTFPPWDLWFAGERVNYYYFGYAVVGALQRLSGVSLPVLFNVGVGLFHALVLSAAFGLGYNLTERYRDALLAVTLTAIMGNLNAAVHVALGKNLLTLDWFGSARVIAGTINEFPFFSFIFGDLHAYVLAFPLAVCALLLSLDLLLDRRPSFLGPASGWRRDIPRWFLMALLVGALLPTHTWDYVTYFGLIVVSLALRNLADGSLTPARRFLGTLVPAVLLAAASVTAYLPFFLSFRQERILKWVSFSRTDFSDFFQVFGTQFLITLTLFLVVLACLNRKRGPREKAVTVLFGVASAVILFRQTTLLYLVGYSLCAIVLLIVLLARGDPADRDKPWGLLPALPSTGPLPGGVLLVWVAVLAALGALLGLGCELFYVNDHYSGNLERMNTVFKVYLQMWFLWSAAATGALVLMGALVRGYGGVLVQRLWWGTVGLLLAAGLLYPFASTHIRTLGFHKEATLDGLHEFRKRYPADAKAVEWLQENVSGLPVILESQENAYVWNARFATFAGLPTVLGWGNHEAGWRGDWDAVLRRSSEIDRIYKATDPQETVRLLDLHAVEYVVVGALEKEKYPAEGLRKFSDFMDLVYAEDGVLIFRRRA